MIAIKPLSDLLNISSIMNASPNPREKVSSLYLEPLVIAPALEHRHTFIILHGRGSNAAEFGPDLLQTSVSSSKTFKDAFPHAKFLFPTASKRRAITFNRSVINQWFDNGSLQTPDERVDLQIEGLRETSNYIHTILKQEINIVGQENVVLGGLSQGCAATLISLLTWDGEPLSAAFGMCGWLPFRKQMDDIAQSISLSRNNAYDEGQDDLFGTANASKDLNPTTEAAAFLLEELDMPTLRPTLAFQRIPWFLGHGDMDWKVPIELGEDAANCLRGLGVSVDWNEYAKLGHWYSTSMLADLVEFLRKTTGWDEGEEGLETSSLSEG